MKPNIIPKFRSLSKGLLIGMPVILTSVTANAAVISNANISLNIDDANGAIYSLSYLGSEYTRTGAEVSDWGMQLGTDGTTFRINTTNGLEQIPVTTYVAGSTVTASGVYSAGGALILVNRSYSLSSTHLVEIVSSFTNIGSIAATVRYFDTYDPDQPSAYDNLMDVYALGGFDVACSTDESTGNTMILAGQGGFTTVASGGPFNIADSTALNGLFTSPVDANGALLDQGMHSGYEFSLELGQSVERKHFLALGETKAIAESALVVPEPSSSLLSVIGAGLALMYRRRK